MKTPDRDQASSGVVRDKQLMLFADAEFSPIWPKTATLAESALCLLLCRNSLTSPEFQAATRSWRLAAYINALRNDGWPVQVVEIPFSDDPTRYIARYFMPEWVKQAVSQVRKADRGAYAS